MQRKIILWLFGAILAVIVIIFVTAPDIKTADTSQGQPLWPSAWDQIEQIQIVRLSDAHQSVELKKTESSWVVPDKYNYPADQKKLRALFATLVQGTYVQRKTTKAGNHAVLQVEAIDAKDRKSVFLSLLNNAEQSEFQLILGKDGPVVAGQKTQYARLPSQDQVWLVSHLPVAQVSADEWMSDQFLKILNTDIVRIHYQAEGQTDFTLKRASQESHDFSLPEIPDGWQAKNSYDINQAAYLLEYVDYTDVMPLTLKADRFFTVGKTVFETFQGLIVTVNWYTDMTDALWADFNLVLNTDVALSEEDKIASQAMIDRYQPLLFEWRYKMPDRHRDIYLAGLAGYLEVKSEVSETE